MATVAGTYTPDVSAAAADPLVGRLIDGRYLVRERVARGGMATVYAALDRRLDRQVAVKVMHAHLADDADFTARFVREARSAARLSHPNVVQVFDQGADGDVVYLTMEFLHGRTLREVLAVEGVLTPREALEVAEPMLDALAAAHRAGIVHRDVKPENVVLTDDGRVKVADFGLARAASASTATAGLLLGTVAYLSPELVARGVADARSDVYAVGVMLYEMLTGSQPFVGDVPIQIAYRHVHEDVPPPSDTVPGLAAALDGLVLAATARDPDERPADAGVLGGLVRSLRAELPADVLDARPAQPAPGVAQPGTTEVVGLLGPHPTRALRTALLPLRRPLDDDPDDPDDPHGGTGDDAYDGHDADPDPAPGGPADHLAALGARRRRRGAAALAAVLVLALAAGVAGWWFTGGPGARVAVAEVAGLAVDDARLVLAGQSLVVQPEERYDDAAAAGRVIGTRPEPGEQVRRDTTVTVLVSKGPRFVDVPTLVGATAGQARSRLAAAGLVAGPPDRAYDDDVPAGRVLRSSPGAGFRARSGSTVALTLSRGPAPVLVADVRGLLRGDAVRRLTRAGLEVDASARAYDPGASPVPAGSVLSQSTPPGVRVPRGSTVRLVISRGPPLVAVPDLVGRQVDAAQGVLRGLGLAVRRDEVLGGFFGTVRAQRPAARTLVPRGSTVTITVV